MDDGNKERIKNLIIYSSCSISFVTIFTSGVNIAKKCPYPYNVPIIISSCVLSLGVPRLIKRIFVDKDDDEDSEMK